MKRHNAELLLVAVTILWGGTFAVVKTAMVDVSPSMFVLLRFAIATVVALALWPGALRSDRLPSGHFRSETWLPCQADRDRDRSRRPGGLWIPVRPC